MSLTPISRQLLRRQLLQPAFSKVQICRAQSIGKRWYADGQQQERESFKGQLYQSTHERVQRERADEKRFAEYREARKSGSSLSIAVPIVLAVGIFGGWFLGKQEPAKPNLSSTLPLSKTVPPEFDITAATLQAAWADFKEILGEENVSMEQADLDAMKGSEWSSYTAKDHEVHNCIVKPETTEDVSAIMKVCHKRRIPVTAYSGGTSLEGHYAATRGGVCVDFSRMDNILHLHEQDLDVVVQPAVGWETLNDELGEKGLFFPPDPGPGAKIGGMIACGCSGTNAYRYGTMKDWVIGVTVVLADGTIVKTKQRPRKSSAGYDLTRTFVGSEGTLGLVTEATLKVTPKPQNTSVAVCTFPDIRSAADCVFKVVGDGVPIAAVEILDDEQMKCINYVGQTSRKWDEVPTLFFKFAGTKQAVDEHVGIVRKHAKSAGNKTFEFAKDAAECEELWEARKQALWSVMSLKKDESDHVWTTDVAVPISRLPDIIDETKADLTKSGLTGTIVGHVGDGNFHAIILYNDKESEVAEEIVHKMVKRAIELEGTATGEHGVGLIKRDYLEHETSESTVDLMRTIKKAFDPLCLLNCDKVVRSQQPAKGEVAEW